jgi:putative polyhydroxyalkanoate system protein
MASVKVQQAHTLGASMAKAKLATFESDLAKYKARLDWSGNTAQVKGIGVSGNVLVTDANVSVNLELGMLARAAGVDAGKLQNSIAKRLASALAG